MNLYYYIVDHGDGSAGVRFCTEDNLPALEDVLEDAADELSMNEGVAGCLTLPEGTDVMSLGISKHRFFKPKE